MECGKALQPDPRLPQIHSRLETWCAFRCFFLVVLVFMSHDLVDPKVLPPFPDAPIFDMRQVRNQVAYV